MTARAHGTHACYVHGPTGTANGHGCRCDECKQANRDYERLRNQRTTPPYVSADPVREHIAWLSVHGVGLKTLATVSGVSHGALWKIVYGAPGRGPNKRVRPATRDAILAVRPDQGADGARVPAAETLHHIDTLVGRGWTKAAISAAIGQNGRTLQVGHRWVTRRTSRAIARLLDQPVPDTPGTTRAAVAAPAVARKRARSARRRLRVKAEAHLHDPPGEAERILPLAPLLAFTGATPSGLGRLVGASWLTITRWADDGIPGPTAERIARTLGTTADDIWPTALDLPTLDVALDTPGAPCRQPDVPAWLFFPDVRDTETIAAAKAVCATCPHATRCADYATTHHETGIWGGTTDTERSHRREEDAA